MLRGESIIYLRRQYDEADLMGALIKPSPVRPIYPNFKNMPGMPDVSGLKFTEACWLYSELEKLNTPREPK